jgi:hypothetical protein
LADTIAARSDMEVKAFQEDFMDPLMAAEV